MGGWTQPSLASMPMFVADWEAIARNTGRQVDWSVVTGAAYQATDGHKVIKAGTAMVQLANGKIVPRAIRPGTEEAIGLLISTADEKSQTDALTGYGIIVGGVIYENLLPEAVATYKTELNTNGYAWVWAVYQDSREA